MSCILVTLHSVLPICLAPVEDPSEQQMSETPTDVVAEDSTETASLPDTTSASPVPSSVEVATPTGIYPFTVHIEYWAMIKCHTNRAHTVHLT